MNVICISLSCGSKKTNVVARPPEKIPRRKRSSCIDEETKLHNKEENPSRNHNITSRFQELGMGEPSRNVIEMIIRASSANTKRSSKRIKRVLRVNNPADTVAKFENYREKVMMISSNEHPRSIVDGNELLQFYGTTMRCSSSSSSTMRVLSQVCRDPGCRVCRIIESGFDTWYNKVHGIRVSSKSQSMSEDVGVAAKNGINRAVIICRTIAGGVVGVGDDMIVANPTALLPCFVVVFH